MKINTQNQSRFLSREDLASPIVATMDRVTEDPTLRNPQILHFAPADRLKPFPMNVTNRRILVSAYGDDPAAWHGQPVELYFNPSIPNPRTPEHPGGICVPIPARPAPAPGPATRPATAPASNRNGARPAAAPVTKPAPATLLAAELARALAGFAQAGTAHNLDDWWNWAEEIPFDDAQRAELSRGYVAAQTRTATASGPAAGPPRQPASAGRR